MTKCVIENDWNNDRVLSGESDLEIVKERVSSRKKWFDHLSEIGQKYSCQFLGV